MTLVISGFPGVGKTFLKENFPDLNVSDPDSSIFSKRDDFPEFYIELIKALIYDEKDIVLVSSHKVVRDALAEQGIDFISVTPSLDCKDEYLERYRQRGSSQEFVDLLDANWESWISDIHSSSNVFQLGRGEFLSDFILWLGK